MELIIVRHGIAIDHDDPACPADAERSLTAEGRKKTRVAARGLRKVIRRADRVVASPLRRATETAGILAAEFGLCGAAIGETAALLPDADPRRIVHELRAEEAGAGVILVGHNPHLSGLIALLLTGDAEGMRVDLRKAGACVIRMRSARESGGAALVALLRPAQLRAMARGG